MTNTYEITVFDGPSYGGGDIWPFPPVEEIVATDVTKAMDLAVAAAKAAAKDAGYASGDMLTVIVSGDDSAERTVVV